MALLALLGVRMNANLAAVKTDVRQSGSTDRHRGPQIITYDFESLRPVLRFCRSVPNGSLSRCTVCKEC